MTGSGATAESRPEVLVVDDDPGVADTFAAQLPDDYDVTVRYDGESALEVVSESTDVVLLDRRMPGLSGEEVLDRIRERELGCRVVVVSSVDPDFDVEAMPFDDYVCKPVDVEDLVAAIENQLELRERDDRLDEYLTVHSKLMHLELQKPAAELEGSEEYRRLKRRADELEPEVESAVDDFEQIRERFEGLTRAV